MKWSWKLIRIAGIDVHIHATFLFLIAWVGVTYWTIGQSWQAVLSGLAFVMVLFVCVVMHEYGHALTARRFGFKTKRITLLPIGGVASFETLPEDPKQEMIVALAGPAVNVVIALGIWLWLRVNDIPIRIEDMDIAEGFSLAALMMVNMSLAIFNLLPAFPMDGGRVFRAALSFRMTRFEATKIAAKTGQSIAMFLGLLGLLFNPFLIIIAMFIWLGASSESTMEQLKLMLSGITAKQAMLTDFATLAPTDKLARAMALTLESNQTEFPIVENGAITKVLTQTDLLRGLNEHGDGAVVEAYATGQASHCSNDAPLLQTFETLIADKSRLIAVTDARRVVGIIDLQNVMEFVNFRTALKY